MFYYLSNKRFNVIRSYTIICLALCMFTITSCLEMKLIKCDIEVARSHSSSIIEEQSRRARFSQHIQIKTNAIFSLNWICSKVFLNLWLGLLNPAWYWVRVRVHKHMIQEKNHTSVGVVIEHTLKVEVHTSYNSGWR